jgi:hypothetical protein
MLRAGTGVRGLGGAKEQRGTERGRVAFLSPGFFCEHLSRVLQASSVKFFFARPPRRPLRTASALGRRVPDLAEIEARLGIRRSAPPSPTAEEVLAMERRAQRR